PRRGHPVRGEGEPRAVRHRHRRRRRQRHGHQLAAAGAGQFGQGGAGIVTLRAPILRPPILRPWAVSPRLAVGLAVGLLLASLSIAAYTERLANAQKLREVGVQAEILAGSVAGALAFDDAAVA